MASSKSRSRNSGNSRNRSGSRAGGRAAGGTAANGKNPRTQTAAAVRATPATAGKPAGATATRSPRQAAVAPEPAEVYEPATSRPGPPTWLQITSLALAVIGLAISAYETYAHYNGSHLAGCPSGPGSTFDCSAVITSSQSMVFNVFPVAVLGLAYYVFALVIFSPWAWRFTDRAIRLGSRTIRISSRDVNIVRLGSVILGMGFVMYLIYAEFQIGEVCEYCSGVHLVTFLLFCITIVSAALWGLGKRTSTGARS